MKKIQLNKQIIASLDNPNRIFGGEGGGPTVSCNTACATDCYPCATDASCATQKTCIYYVDSPLGPIPVKCVDL